MLSLVSNIEYTAKNDQVVAIFVKTGLNNVVQPTLFTVVNNVEQYCYTRDSGSTILFNIVQSHHLYIFQFEN